MARWDVTKYASQKSQNKLAIFRSLLLSCKYGFTIHEFTILGFAVVGYKLYKIDSYGM